MSCQDDLSQLMPSLYSRVKLTYGSDNTADLSRYANKRPVLDGIVSEVYPASTEQQHLPEPTAEQQRLQNTFCINPRAHQEPMRLKGTGRAVTHRAFHLELRCDCPQQVHKLQQQSPLALADLHLTCRLPVTSQQAEDVGGTHHPGVLPCMMLAAVYSQSAEPNVVTVCLMYR